MSKDSGLEDTAASPGVAPTVQSNDQRAAEAPVEGSHELPITEARRYRIDSEVGRGGLGRVVSAHDRVLDRDVAIKELHSPDDVARRRFLREALVTARLQHPAIVPIYEAGRWNDGAPYYAMKLVAGRPLSDAITAASTLQERLALIPMVLAVADALAYAHSHRIVHRDLKPGNVLIGSFGETVVIDWGLAKDLSIDDRDALDAGPYRASNRDQTMVGQLFGTPAYMAPEQAAGGEVDERSDVYALGAILHHVLAGKSPHRGTTLDEMLSRVIAGDVASAGEISGVSPDLAAIVRKAMSRDPGSRYKDAGELAEDLRRFQTGQLVGSYRYSRRELVRRFVRRHRVPVTIAAIALLTLGIGGTFAIRSVLAERDRADTEARLAVASKTEAELAQRVAEDTAASLLIEKARTLVATRPAEAVAMVKPLATSHWRDARAIAQAARATGLPWGMPGPKRPTGAEVARDGAHAVVTGDDGSLRVYDLATHHARTLIERGPALRATFADGGRLVTWSARTIRVLDATSGQDARHTEAAAAIRDLHTTADRAYWIDEHRSLWQVGIDGGEPQAIRADEPLDTLSISPDGRWLALGGERHLLLADGKAAPIEIMLGAARDFDWSSDGKLLFAHVDDQVVVVDVSAAPVIRQRATAGAIAAIGSRGSVPYTLGPTGVSAMTFDRADRMPIAGDPIAFVHLQGDVLVAATHNNLLAIADDGDHSIPVPGPLWWFAGARGGSRIVGAATDRVFVWDLSEMMPHKLADTGSVWFAGNDWLVIADDDKVSRVELATGKTSPIGTTSVLDLAASVDGRAICLIDLAHHARLVIGDQSVELGETDMALFAADALILASAKPGSIERYELASRRRTKLVVRESPVRELAVGRGGNWLVASFADDTLWRARPDGTSSTLSQPADRIAIAPDGTVAIARADRVSTWSPDGTVASVAELPATVSALAMIDNDHALAIAGDGRAFAFSLRARTDEPQMFRIDAQRATMAADGGLLVATTRATLEVTDPFSGWSWPLSRGTYFEPRISPDGRRIVARTARGWFAWRLETPGTADEVARSLERSTNAVVAPRRNTVTWSP